MNTWRDKVGCEVNVCTATYCDAKRMSFCALRRAYQERVAYIRLLRDTAKSQQLKDKYAQILRGMEADG